jgi:cell division protein ZapE
VIDLSARRPTLTPQQLTQSLSPSARFGAVRFGNYRPNPAYPSQAQARDALEAFAARAAQGPVRPGALRLFKRSKPEGQGLYLDGGFGVGKTHLLASTYHAAQAAQTGSRAAPKVALMSFQDLMYIIGALGMVRAVETFKDHNLLLIDEFELDDPGNTHMANTFLATLMPGGASVVATSNTEPGALGQGRFNATDFQRQIQGISKRFQNLGIDGPDYRQRGAAPAGIMSDTQFGIWTGQQDSATLALIDFRDLGHLLTEVHPSRFARLLDGVAALGISDLCPMRDQNVALRFVHFIDKVYDLGLRAAFSGAALGTLFDESFRHGAYAKKYSRALSRLSEMLQESRAELSRSAD